MSNEAADQIIHATVGDTLLAKASTAKAIRFTTAFGIENHPQCQQRLLHMENGPAHLFADALDFLSHDMHRMCNDARMPKAVLREEILACKTKPNAWCVKCRAQPSLSAAPRWRRSAL